VLILCGIYNWLSLLCTPSLLRWCIFKERSERKCILLRCKRSIFIAGGIYVTTFFYKSVNPTCIARTHSILSWPGYWLNILSLGKVDGAGAEADGTLRKYNKVSRSTTSSHSSLGNVTRNVGDLVLYQARFTIRLSHLKAYPQNATQFWREDSALPAQPRRPFLLQGNGLLKIVTCVSNSSVLTPIVNTSSAGANQFPIYINFW